MKHPGQIQPDRYDAGYNPGYAYTNMDLLEDATLYLAIAFAIAWAVLYIKERVSMENKGFEQIAKKARAPYLANPEKYHAPSKRMNKYVQAILITTVVCICMYGILFGLFAWLAWHLNEPNGTKILTDLGWRLWAIMGGLWCFLIFTAVMTAKYDHYFDEPIE